MWNQYMLKSYIYKKKHHQRCEINTNLKMFGTTSMCKKYYNPLFCEILVPCFIIPDKKFWYGDMHARSGSDKFILEITAYQGL